MDDKWNSVAAQRFLNFAETAIDLRRAVRELDDVVIRGSYKTPEKVLAVSKELAGVSRKFLVAKLEDAMRSALHWAEEVRL